MWSTGIGKVNAFFFLVCRELRSIYLYIKSVAFGLNKLYVVENCITSSSFRGAGIMREVEVEVAVILVSYW